MTDTTRERAVVVVPAFNEASTVAGVVDAILSAGLPVVVVDDGSADETARIARDAGAVVLELPFNLGVGGALRTGFRWAIENNFSIAVQCDADGQHDPDDVRRMIDAAVTTDVHLLIGTRFGGIDGFKATWLRRIPMRVLARVASRAARTPMTDASSGFRVIRGPLLREFAMKYPMHYLESFEVLVQSGRRGYRVAEIPVAMHERQGGVPSAGTSASVRYLARVLLALLIGTGHKYQDFRGGSEHDQ